MMKRLTLYLTALAMALIPIVVADGCGDGSIGLYTPTCEPRESVFVRDPYLEVVLVNGACEVKKCWYRPFMMSEPEAIAYCRHQVGWGE